MDKQYDPNVTPKKQVFSAQIDLKKFEKATDEEKKQQDVMSESTTFFRDGMRKLMKNPLAVLSLVLLAIILITIIVAPMIVPYKYEEIMSINGKRDKGAKNLAPFTYSKMEQAAISTRAAPASRTSSAPTSSAATISSASSTARASR